MKEETLKAKLAKTIEKKELVKKYDDYILNKPPIQKENIKPIEKEKKEKKIIYKYASSSSSSSDEDNESEKIVYVKNVKKEITKTRK
jgi:hypothetical protein